MQVMTENAPGPAAAERYVEVALKLPLRTEFTYRLPASLEARVGSRVRVPFRGKMLAGVVTAVREECDLDPAKLRDVAQVVEGGTLLPDPVLQLAKKIAGDYGCSLGIALDAALPAAAKQRGVRRIPHLELAVPHGEALAKIDELEETQQARARLLRAVLEFGAPMPVLEATRRAGTSDSPWKTLVKHGLLRRLSIVEEGEEWQPVEGMEAADVQLNDDQRRAVDAVVATLDGDSSTTFLLHGVTGSGKTEVYLQVLAGGAPSAGAVAIVLVPEISLDAADGRAGSASRFPGCRGVALGI